MTKKCIAFLYNVRHKYPDQKDLSTHAEIDFDDPITIKTMIKHFKNAGFDVLPIEADEKAYIKLLKNKEKIDLVFNYSEGKNGNDRETHLPSMLEMLEIPYTGSTPLTQALALNKAKAKEILVANKVPTTIHQLFKTGNEKLDKRFKFPVIVKPIGQGSSGGITNKSVVFNQTQLKKQIAQVVKTYHQEAIVEPFLTGREFSVALLGNPPRILPIIEADHSKLPKDYLPIDSLEVKWFFEEQEDQKGASEHLICPAKISKSLENKIQALCLKTWEALNIRDWCRIDIRCDAKNNPYVLEVNSPAGMIPPEVSTTSYFSLAARAAGINYEQLLTQIINTSLKRYAKK